MEEEVKKENAGELHTARIVLESLGMCNSFLLIRHL